MTRKPRKRRYFSLMLVQVLLPLGACMVFGVWLISILVPVTLDQMLQDRKALLLAEVELQAGRTGELFAADAGHDEHRDGDNYARFHDHGLEFLYGHLVGTPAGDLPQLGALTPGAADVIKIRGALWGIRPTQNHPVDNGGLLLRLRRISPVGLPGSAGGEAASQVWFAVNRFGQVLYSSRPGDGDLLQLPILQKFVQSPVQRAGSTYNLNGTDLHVGAFSEVPGYRVALLVDGPAADLTALGGGLLGRALMAAGGMVLVLAIVLYAVYWRSFGHLRETVVLMSASSDMMPAAVSPTRIAEIWYLKDAAFHLHNRIREAAAGSKPEGGGHDTGDRKVS